MKNCFILFFISLALVTQAQSITINNSGCFSNLVVIKNGTTAISGTTRNTYSGFNSLFGMDCVVIYTSNGGGRWEVQLGVDGVALFYNTKASAPFAPALGFGTWVNTGVGCSNLLTFSGTGTTTTLPVELINFDATTEGGKTQLAWATGSEVNNKLFDIERSFDGKAFSSIGQVKANNKASTYQYVDNAPFATAYYRLRQIDFDGTEKYSKIVSATQKGGKTLTIYPTLVSNGLLTTNAEEGNYVIFNLLGQAVQTGKTPPLGVGGLDVSTLAKGTYILKVGTEQAKFVKQ